MQCPTLLLLLLLDLVLVEFLPLSLDSSNLSKDDLHLLGHYLHHILGGDEPVTCKLQVFLLAPGQISVNHIIGLPHLLNLDLLPLSNTLRTPQLILLVREAGDHGPLPVN